jgi:superfamily II DNA or RNA helicase
MQQNTCMATKARTNLTSLERLERQLQAITPDRAQGDAWEKALKGWINAGGHPELTKAWMWGEWPGKLKAGLKGDKGVDLVAETRDKQLVAIQVKFRRDPNDPVTAPEVQKLVGSYRKHFALFALASNAWSATRGVSEAVGDEDAMLILREQLLESSYDWAAKKSIKRTKFTPFPFQKVAAENVRKALAKGGRAQIVMACGTGKTVTMLLAAEALDAQRVLVLAPTLLLVKQLRDEWISKRRPDREWASLAVCSDIGDGMDATEIAPAEFGAPPTTNPDEIAAFLKNPGRRVVFGTYASSDRIAKAQKKAGVPSFDLAVADEAHRIAGVVAVKDKSERSNRVMLEEKEIKAVRRLFATATPRITGSKNTRDGEEILIESMDDESRFGKVAHSVTFQEAVKLKRLVPYKLVVTIVTNDEVADAVQNRRFIDINGKPYAADEVATAIAIRRAYKELGISKIISYHSRVAGAKSFADLITQVPGRGKSPVTEHVAGSMPVNDRKQVLNRLAAATEPYLVTNARCLTEGIDVPALDAVAFADPRKSQVDIVQAVGRAMRKPMGKTKKTTGYIILPVYLTNADLEDPETAVEGSAFEPVLQVLRALKDHDPFMAKFMAKILVAKGKKPHRKEGGIGEILEVSIGDELDKVLARQLLEAVQLRAVSVTTDSYEVGLEVFKRYVEVFRHSRIEQDEVFEGFKLGQWASVVRDRARTGTHRRPLNASDIGVLNQLGFIWDAIEERFERQVALLRAYAQENGNTRVPHDFTVGDIKLGNWVHSLRQRKSLLSADKIALLESLGMIWDVVDFDERQKLKLLKEYLEQNHSQVIPQGTVIEGYDLGQYAKWLRKQGGRHLEASLRAKLVKIGFDFTPATSFDRGLKLMRQYVARTGHSRVPQTWVEDGFRLGAWLARVRQSKKNGTLNEASQAELQRLGVTWEPFVALREDGFRHLRAYYLREGHSNVPRGWIEGAYKLGAFVQTLRTSREKLSTADKRRLREVNFSLTVKEDMFERKIVQLEQFYRKHHHLRFAGSDDPAADALDSFCQGLRRRRSSLDSLTLRRLKSIDFRWGNAHDASFEQNLALLIAFKKREGSVEVPSTWKEDGFGLGAWVYNIKRGNIQVTAERRRKLIALGIKPGRSRERR